MNGDLRDKKMPTIESLKNKIKILEKKVRFHVKESNRFRKEANKAKKSLFSAKLNSRSGSRRMISVEFYYDGAENWGDHFTYEKPSVSYGEEQWLNVSAKCIKFFKSLTFGGVELEEAYDGSRPDETSRLTKKEFLIKLKDISEE